MSDMNQLRLISFDCYGTLVDRKEGVLNAIQPLLEDYLIEMEGDQIFGLFREFEENLVTGEFHSYHDILVAVMKQFGKHLNINLQKDDLNILANTFPRWPFFPDTLPVLQELSQNYRLAIISNADRPALEETVSRTGIEFDFLITSGELESYKPSPENFIEAMNHFRLSSGHILHVAQSRFHDILPARDLGIPAVWINRYNDPVPPLEDTEYPGMHFPDLSSFAGWLG